MFSFAEPQKYAQLEWCIIMFLEFGKLVNIEKSKLEKKKKLKLLYLQVIKLHEYFKGEGQKDEKGGKSQKSKKIKWYVNDYTDISEACDYFLSVTSKKDLLKVQLNPVSLNFIHITHL